MSDILFFFEEIEPLNLPKSKLKKNIRQLVEDEGKICGNINVVFCSDDYLLNINQKYLNHDYYTDIVTFDQTAGEKISGDLFISVDRIRENAGIYKVSIHMELVRVIFHGVLHLLGYEDDNNFRKLSMKEKEDFYLDRYDIHG